MASMKEPYEDGIDISYVQQPWGVDRVRSASVKPHRRYELGLIAEGLVELGHPIPVVYCGHAKGHAGSEPPPAEGELASGLSVRPYWEPRGGYQGKYSGLYDAERNNDPERTYLQMAGNGREGEVEAHPLYGFERGYRSEALYRGGRPTRR